MKYSKNEKLFDIYVFLTTFSRKLIEVFIGTILFKAGFSFQEVILFALLNYAFCALIAAPCVAASKKFSNKALAFVGVAAFIILQVMLNYISLQIWYLVVAAFVYAIYRKAYWVSRRYYTMRLVSRQENVARKYSAIAFLNQFGIMASSYVGAILLEFVSINALTLISFALLIFGTFILHFIKFPTEKSNIKINPLKAARKAPFSSLVHIACYELINICKVLFPLFLIIYVKDTYTTIGIVNLVADVAALVFIYIYGRLINKKRNFLKLSILLFIVAKICQINSEGIALMLFSFFEGFVARMYEQSFHKEFLVLSRKFDYFNFNLLYELVMDVSRLAVLALLFFCFADVKVMLYATFCFIAVGLFFKFKT